MVKGLIFDIRKFSIHDGPGIRTTVFFKGCPLACWWCHNPEGQSFEPQLVERLSRCIRCGSCVLACRQGAVQLVSEVPTTDRELCLLCGDCVEGCAADARQIAGHEMSVEEVLDEIQRDLPFYESSGGGVTFSGGEPLSQVEFLVEILRACKRIELHTSLDTSGYAPWDNLDMVREYVDLFLYDLKLVDDEQHYRYTGVSNQVILENLEKLSQKGHQIVVRVPLIPGITASIDNIQAIGSLVSGLGNIERVDLLPYHASAEGKYDRLGLEYELAGRASPAETEMLDLAETLLGFGLSVNVGG